MPAYKILEAAKVCGLAVLLFDLNQKARPSAVGKLKLALSLPAAVQFVDFTGEFPGHTYYTRAADDARRGRLRVDGFYASGHAHCGGTFRWYGPAGEERRGE